MHRTIGASDVPVVLGQSPWRSPLELWAELVNGVQPTPAGTAADIGTDLEEPTLRRWYQTKPQGSRFEPGIQHPDPPILHATIQWAHARPDGVYWAPGDSRPWLVECKTVHPISVRKRWADGPPEYVRLQCMWQLGVVWSRGVDARGVLIVMRDRGSGEIHEYVFTPTREEVDQLYATVSEWVERHVIARQSPGWGNVDVSPDETVVDLDERPDLATAYARLVDARAALDLAKSEEAEARKALLDALTSEGAKSAVLRGRKVATVVQTKGRTSVSLSNVKKQRPDLYEALQSAGLIKTGKPSTSLRVYLPEE